MAAGHQAKAGMTTTEMRKVMARQGRKIDTLERELKTARDEIERLSK